MLIILTHQNLRSASVSGIARKEPRGAASHHGQRAAPHPPPTMSPDTLHSPVPEPTGPSIHPAKYLSFSCVADACYVGCHWCELTLQMERATSLRQVVLYGSDLHRLCTDSAQNTPAGCGAHANANLQRTNGASMRTGHTPLGTQAPTHKKTTSEAAQSYRRLLLTTPERTSLARSCLVTAGRRTRGWRGRLCVCTAAAVWSFCNFQQLSWSVRTCKKQLPAAGWAPLADGSVGRLGAPVC